MLEKYVKGKRVGRGQHGDVYHCWEVGSNQPLREVAIKAVMRKNARAEKLKMIRRQHHLPTSPHTRLTDKLGSTEQKIRKEIAIMKKCRHPNVVQLLEVIDDNLNEKIFLVMEYLGGGEIRWRNSNNEPVLTVDQTRRIIRDVILGVEYLHFQGIIHRDIKPANLLWTHDRQVVKITDFGVSHFSYAQRLAAVGRGQATCDDPRDPILVDDSDLTKRVGTPPFLAPEVVCEYLTEPAPTSATRNMVLSAFKTVIRSPPEALPLDNSLHRPPITKAVDVWALGITLYCLLFGKIPFSTSDGEFILYKIICNKDWDVPETMGSEGLPTGGRSSRGHGSKGSAIIKILDKILQKDINKRITLDKLKRNRWLLDNISDSEKWLRETSPWNYEPATVTASETTSAVSIVQNGCWSWRPRFAKRMSPLFCIFRLPPSLQVDDDDTVGVNSAMYVSSKFTAGSVGMQMEEGVTQETWRRKEFASI